MLLTYEHSWMLITSGVFARSFDGFHETSSFLFDGVFLLLKEQEHSPCLESASALRQSDMAPDE